MMTFLGFAALFAGTLWLLMKDHRKHYPKL